jgi:hypothetical protein
MQDFPVQGLRASPFPYCVSQQNGAAVLSFECRAQAT